VPILPSAGRRIQELLRLLESARAPERESAVARLTLLGPRTIAHLEGFLGDAKVTGRLAALELLERQGEPRGLACVLALTRDPHEDVARRAIEVATTFPEPRTAEALRFVLKSGSPPRRRAAVLGLGKLHGLGLVEAVEPLLRLVLDTDEEEVLRLDALESLSSLDRRALLPALQTLATDRSPAVARAAAGLSGRISGVKRAESVSVTGADISTLLAALVSPRTSPAKVSAVVDALVKRRSPALLALLGRRLEALEAAADPGAEMTARSKARLHRALGALGSRLALHDLRQMLKARPLHAARDLLAAAGLVGDASLVPVLAALAADEPRLVESAATALQAIAHRERLRRTSRVVRALGPEHKAALLALWPPQRSASAGASRDRKRKLR
jgi:HEAT repeat protein